MGEPSAGMAAADVGTPERIDAKEKSKLIFYNAADNEEICDNDEAASGEEEHGDEEGAEEEEDDEEEEEEDEDDGGPGDVDRRRHTHEAMMAQLVQEESTPFSKIINMLRSLRAAMPGYDQKKDSLHNRASFDHHLVHPSLSSSPLNRLDWCIDHLCDFVSKRYASDMPGRDSMSKLLQQKLAEHDANSEEFLLYLQENYIKTNALPRARSRGYSSPKETRVDLEHTEPAFPDLSASLNLGSRKLSVGKESGLSAAPRGAGELTRGDSDAAMHDSRLRQRKWSSTRDPFDAEQLDEEAGDRGALNLSVGKQRLPPSRVPRLQRMQRVRSAPVLNPQTMTTLPTFSPDCTKFLEDLSPWGLNVFSLDKLAGSRPLLALSSQIFHRDGLAARLKLNPIVLARFCAALEDGYARYPQIFYHNNLHACDVMHSTYLLLQAPALRGAFSDLEIFSAVLAAAAHDVGHPGVTNQFLVATQSPLAILYNDQAVLENHHAATTFKIMLQQEYNVLSCLDPPDQLACRTIIIETIMNTDMARHFQFLNNFRNLVETKRSDAGLFDVAQLRDEDRLLLLCAIVHCADLASSTKPWDLCYEWCQRLLMEFFNQGDREAEVGLEVGPLYDRRKTSIPKSQVNFINFIAMPLWEVWDLLVGGSSLQLKALKENRESWQRLADQEAAQKAASEQHPPSPHHDDPHGHAHSHAPPSHAKAAAPAAGASSSTNGDSSAGDTATQTVA